MDIRIRDQILQPKESFRYLGSVLHTSGRIVDDVAHRTRAGWMKWRAASGVLCDKRIPLKLKGKFYRAAIRPARLYGSECWPITKALAFRVEVAELRMLRWTCGKTMVDMISNEIDKMREGRWFGHVKRRPQSAPVRRVEAMVVEGSRRRGRPKLRWEDRLKMDMKELRLSEDMTSDRNAYEVVHQEIDIRIRDQILQPKKSFRYLGSVLHRSGRIVDDVAHRTRAGWMKWRAASGGGGGGIENAEVDLRRPQSAPVRRVEAMVVEGSRRRGRPKLRWEDRLKMDMKELRLSEDMTSDRNAWR
nr:ataxia telangiectasia mutated family protein [Tanacetum cinerariifolium]